MRLLLVVWLAGASLVSAADTASLPRFQMHDVRVTPQASSNAGRFVLRSGITLPPGTAGRFEASAIVKAATATCDGDSLFRDGFEG